jgi:predicted amidohydrolase YtcJ
MHQAFFMTVYDGDVVTCDKAGSVQRFLVEDRGKIAYTGPGLPADYARAPRVALNGGALVPAFADTHIHFMSHALFAGGLDVRQARTIEETVAKVADFAAARRDAAILGFGASAHSVAERRLPTRTDLDRAAPGRPVFLVKYDGHAAILNSKLLGLLPAGLAGLRGFDADSGLMTQEAFFRVTNFVTGKVSLGATLSSMLAAVDGMAARGIGLLHSVSGVGFPLDMDVTLESLFARGLRNPLQYRLFFQTMEVDKVIKRKLPRIGGCFATALDGCFGSVDAALNAPYADDEANAGVLYYPQEQVRDFARRANRAGLQIEMHAIGDRAFQQAVDAITGALADFPRTDHRHAIIHACLPTAEGLESCARAGIALAVQPAFLRWDQEPLSYLSKILGERAWKLSPLRSMRRLGIRLAGGSDAPCTLPDPLASIWAACNHYVDSESLSVQEALNLHTRDAAWLCFDEQERGSLEPGKTADMVVLDRNPLAVDRRELRDIGVRQLLLAGKPYRGGQGRASVLLRGIAGRRKI